ncbi:MAG: hypothetical protein HW413_2416 [Thermoleophilia bacterium]|nr:hypothetical protein [Thermoleophilia bacterium]
MTTRAGAALLEISSVARAGVSERRYDSASSGVLFRGPIGWIAQVERHSGLARYDVVGDPGLEPSHGYDLLELETANDGDAGRELEEARKFGNCPLNGAVGKPRPCRVTASTSEDESRDDVAETAGLNPSIGWLEDDRQRGVVNRD